MNGEVCGNPKIRPQMGMNLMIFGLFLQLIMKN